MLRKFTFLIFFSLLCSAAQAQVVEGFVVDSQTKEPLAFVSIAVRNSVQGTTTDINGKFSFRLPDGGCELLVSYVGYEKVTLPCASVWQREPVLIQLEEKTTGLEEVVVRARENPAFRIIRLALQNKPLHDPFQLPSFQYNSYNKLVIGSKKFLPDSLQQKKDTTGSKTKLRPPSHLFISESYTERRFLAPNLSREVVLANKMSGYKDPIMAMVGTDFQPISFYQEHLTFFDQVYLNPLSAGSTKKYDFILEDQILHEKDTTFLISFEPLPGKNFEGLKGVLAINSDGYALEYVTTGPAGTDQLMQFKLRQQYARVQGQWFPAQLHMEAEFTKYKIGDQALTISSKSEISQIQIAPPLSKKDFNHLVSELAPKANRQTAEQWRVFRPDSLNLLEKNTYSLYDSLSPGQAAFLNGYMGFLEGLVLNQYKVGKVDVIPSRLFGYNEYEGFRVGVGLQTNEDLFRYARVGGYVGYGFRDKALKYGSHLDVLLNRRAEAWFKVSYQQDVVEPGTQEFFRNNRLQLSEESLRDFLTERMDSVERWKAALQVRAFKFLQIEAFVSRETRNPTYAYQYLPLAEARPGSNQTFQVLETGLGLRYAMNERYTQIGRGSTVLRPAYPVFSLYLGKGAEISGRTAAFSFHRAEAKVEHQVVLKGLGITHVQVSTGVISGQVPYSYLFTGHGSQSEGANSRLVIPGHFQTMELYEFLSDRYANVFLSHNFGRLLFRSSSKYVQPEIILAQNLGIGSLRKPENHGGVQFQTMEKGYYESGLLLQNLFRFSYLDLAYLGFGGGAFYRYGPYARPNTKDNIALKVVTSFSF